MAKEKWLYCGHDWDDIVNIIKLTRNPKERLQKFNNIIKREKLTINDILETWCILEKRDIEDCADEWFYNDDIGEVENKECIYWFFNIFTGEALHIKYSIKCSGIIKD